MIITVLGQTDKRAVLYTMLKMGEYLGDCAIVTPLRRFKRLTEDPTEDIGSYRNIDVFVGDFTADDVWERIGHAPHDYDYTFLDNIYTEDTEMVIYVKGAGVDELDQPNLDALEPDEYITIKMGKAEPAPKQVKTKARGAVATTPKHKTYNIPYTSDMMARIEACEFFKELVPISSQAVKVCSEVLSGPTNTPAKQLAALCTRSGQKGAAKK